MLSANRIAISGKRKAINEKYYSTQIMKQGDILIFMGITQKIYLSLKRKKEESVTPL